jgi:hypothetical protein
MSGNRFLKSCEIMRLARESACPTTGKSFALVGQASACQRPIAGAFFLTLTVAAPIGVHGDSLLVHPAAGEERIYH